MAHETAKDYDSPDPFSRGALNDLLIDTTAAGLIGLAACISSLPARPEVDIEVTQELPGEYIPGKVSSILFGNIHSDEPVPVQDVIDLTVDKIEYGEIKGYRRPAGAFIDEVSCSDTYHLADTTLITTVGFECEVKFYQWSMTVLNSK